MPLLRGPRRRAARQIASALLACAVSLTALGTAAAAEERYPSSASTSFTLIGRAFGHGRGLSQYGAYRAGTLGIAATAITDRYYSGSTLGTAPNPLYRVQISSAEGDRYVRFPSVAGLTARDETDTTNQTERLIDPSAFPEVSSWRVVTDAAGLRVQYLAGDGQWISIDIGGKTAFSGTVRIYSNSVTALSMVDEDQGVERPYRGNFRLRRIDASRLALINVVRFEDYLRSVVPSEVPSSWPTSTLQAQAIAARSYAGYYYQHPRSSSYDICDSTACQVYSGSQRETASTDAAVSATAGKARILNGSILRAEFSSSNGGWITEGSAGHSPPGYDSWTDGVWDKSHQWTVTISAADLAAMIGPGYELERMVITGRDGLGDWGGWVNSLRLEGANGGPTVAKVVTGDDIRLRFGLRSRFFTVKGGPDVRWQVTSGLSTNAPSTTHTYGPVGSRLLVGDWDGDGDATPAVLSVVNSEWRWRPSNTNEVSSPAADFRYGPSSCRPIAGDWDGNGTDTPGLACPWGSNTRWRLSNVNAVSVPAVDFLFGASGTEPVVGRWQASMTGDSIGTVVAADGQLQWRLRSQNSAGPASFSYAYGAATDRPVTGDWDGDGITGIGITRVTGERWLWKLRQTASPGTATSVFLAGLTTQQALAGDGVGQPARPILAA